LKDKVFQKNPHRTESRNWEVLFIGKLNTLLQQLLPNFCEISLFICPKLVSFDFKLTVLLCMKQFFQVCNSVKVSCCYFQQ
jgi:hypothetical protein